MRRVLTILGFGLVVLALVLGVALFTDVEAPRLGQRLIRIAGNAAGIELEASRVSLNLRRGLLLEGALARSEANGEWLTVEVDLLEVSCSLIPLLRGEVVVQEIALQSPRIEIVSRVPGPPGVEAPIAEDPLPAGSTWSEDDPTLANRPIPVSIDRLSVIDGRLISRTEGDTTPATTIDDLDLEVIDFTLASGQGSALLRAVGRGRVNAAGFRVDERELSDFRGELAADRGRYVLSGMSVSSRSGDVHVEHLEIDLGQNPYRYRVDATVRDVDLEVLLRDRALVGLGRVGASVSGSGEGPGLSGAVVDAVVTLESGRLPSIAALRWIDRILGTSVDGAAYEETELRFSLVGGRFEVEPLEVVTEIVRLTVSGAVALDGGIELKVGVGLPREAFDRQDVAPEVLDSLTDSRSWLTVPLAVTGTLDNPRFGPDMDAVRAATQRLAESARESARARIRGELDRIIRSRLGL